MNGVDIVVVVCVILLVLVVIVVRFILPRILQCRLKKKGKEEVYACANCKRR